MTINEDDYSSMEFIHFHSPAARPKCTASSATVARAVTVLVLGRRNEAAPLVLDDPCAVAPLVVDAEPEPPAADALVPCACSTAALPARSDSALGSGLHTPTGGTYAWRQCVEATYSKHASMSLYRVVMHIGYVTGSRRSSSRSRSGEMDGEEEEEVTRRLFAEVLPLLLPLPEPLESGAFDSIVFVVSSPSIARQQ